MTLCAQRRMSPSSKESLGKEPIYIQFIYHGNSLSGKTKTWLVATIEDENDRIGEIKWFGPWRCYAFFPSDKTVFEKKCLRNIANFCEIETLDHKLLMKHKVTNT
jgi:hypothetical protein